MAESGGGRGQPGNPPPIAPSGLLGPLRPDKYVRMAGAIRRQGLTAMTGTSLATARRPDGLALVDERGAMTWAELDERTDALAAGLAPYLPESQAKAQARVGLLARN